jgi:hypothetical protein
MRLKFNWGRVYHELDKHLSYLIDYENENIPDLGFIAHGLVIGPGMILYEFPI